MFIPYSLHYNVCIMIIYKKKACFLFSEDILKNDLCAFLPAILGFVIVYSGRGSKHSITSVKPAVSCTWKCDDL